MKRHYPAMRGLAILLVVLNHTVALGMQAYIEADLPAFSKASYVVLKSLELLGWYAVPIFLFLSGSFFAYVAQKKVTLKIVWTNVLHLLWPYIFWSIAYYVLIYFARQLTFTPLGYIKNLIIGFPYHFVPLLIFFIIISPLLVWVSGKIGWIPVLAAIGIYQFLLINLLEPGIYGFTFPAWMDVLVVPVLARTMADWGIYFPMGLLFTLNGKRIYPALERWRHIFLGLSVGFYILTILAVMRIFHAPWARFIYPFFFVLYLPSMSRSLLPYLRRFDEVGKHTYGLYLVHFLLINMIYFLISDIAPVLYQVWFLLFPMVYLMGVYIPLGLMRLFNHPPQRVLYRYIFG